jgi:hypothetical protein
MFQLAVSMHHDGPVTGHIDKDFLKTTFLLFQANDSQVPSFYSMLLKQIFRLKLKSTKLYFQIMRFAIISQNHDLAARPFSQSTTLIIHRLYLSEERAGEAWEHSNKMMLFFSPQIKYPLLLS